MGRIFNIFLVSIFFALTLSGCSDLKAKFIRKPKEDPGMRRYIPVREYDIHPNMELYTKRYIFWKNWHREFMDLVKDQRMTNHKKLIVSIEQEISNLYDMKRMLVDERGDELQPLIEGVEEVEAEIRKQNITSGNRVRIIRKMDILGKSIKENFTYTKMAGEIRDEFRQD
jgi:hypothetical protein